MPRLHAACLFLLLAACATVDAPGAAPAPRVIRLEGRTVGPLLVPAGGILEGAPGAVVEAGDSGPAVVIEAGGEIRSLTIEGRDAGPAGAAILVRGSSARISGCTVAGAGGDGILALRATVTIESTAIYASRAGVAGRRSQLALDGVLIEDCAAAGLDLEERSEGAMRASVIRRCGDGVLLGALARLEAESSAIEENRGAGIRTLFPGAALSLRFVILGGNAAGDRVEPPPVVASTPADPVRPAPPPAPAPAPPALDDLLRVALDTIGFSPADLALPSRRMPRLHPWVKSAMDSPVEEIARIRERAELLCAAATPSAMLEALSPGSREADSSLEEILTAAHDFVRALPPADGLREALLAEEPDMTLLENHLDGEASRNASRVLGERANAFELGALAGWARRIVEALERDSAPPARGGASPPGIGGRVLAARKTNAGWVVWGGAGDNVYPGGIAVIIDAGGDDVYENPAAADSGLGIVLDLGGNDVYRGRIASAERGIAVLVDRAGDDRYEGGVLTQAAACGGVALLWDESGNDRYEAEKAAQAFAVAGVAALVDRSGDDDYAGGAYVQSVAGSNGLACLVDVSGRDRYLARGDRSDELRDPAHRLSFAQGFSSGFRPGAAGGAALLVDGAGSDDYTAALFAQGSAYWGSMAALVDRGGDDVYRARHYVQGAGVHLSAGYLIDLSGRDLYQAFTVAQGCGHDLSFGVLVDDEGSDLYRSDNLSQGAGSTNGTGLLWDKAGDDHYVMESRNLGQGWGVYEATTRRYGSLGIFLDAGGRDAYSGGAGSDGTVWIQGELGVGVDR